MITITLYVKCFREAALWQERQITSLKLGGEARTKPPKYPNVHDSYAEACQGSSFVAGSKVQDQIRFHYKDPFKNFKMG